MDKKIKRAFDLILSICLIIFLLPLLIGVAFLVKLTSRGEVLHWSRRITRGGGEYLMPKFRTMIEGAPLRPTHLMSDVECYLTPIGSFLRKTSIDELPQLWSIIKGDMSFVGPRPALFNQDDLILLRLESKINQQLPGLTGWAQVNGRDDLSIQDKVQYEIEYLNQQSFFFDMKILWLSFIIVLRRSGISH